MIANAKLNAKNQRADVVRAKLMALDLSEQDIADAIAWVRQS